MRQKETLSGNMLSVAHAWEMDFGNILPACNIPALREEFIGRVLMEVDGLGILDWEQQAKNMLEKLNSCIKGSHHSISMRTALNKAFNEITEGPQSKPAEPMATPVGKRTKRVEVKTKTPTFPKAPDPDLKASDGLVTDLCNAADGSGIGSGDLRTRFAEAVADWVRMTKPPTGWNTKTMGERVIRELCCDTKVVRNPRSTVTQWLEEP